MKIGLSKNHDVNYLTQVVKIDSFTKHPDPAVEKLQVAHIEGFEVIVGINEQPGMFLYFPANSQINPALLEYCNLYRHAEKNRNPQVAGLFEDNGRVQAIRLRGQVSEGFLLPLVQFQNFCIDSVNQECEDLDDGREFDIVNDGTKEFWISKKYIPGGERHRHGGSGQRNNQRYKVSNRLKKVIDTQFRFHYQTVLIKKCPQIITPDSWISITKKYDGTSGVSAYVLCRRDLTWREKLARFISGDKSEPVQYDYVYSSRTVIKNPYYNPGVENNKGYYGEVGGDVWMYADKYLRPFLQKGMTFYYEIVGYLPNGKPIQKNNDFKTRPLHTNEEYTYGLHYRILIYRITLTNPDGIVHEFSPHEVQVWCKEKGLEAVKCMYEGYAKDLYPDIDPSMHWNENFMQRLANDPQFDMELDEPECNNKVPTEGIVIKFDNGKSEAFKLKCFAHLNRKQKLLEKGEADIESVN